MSTKTTYNLWCIICINPTNMLAYRSTQPTHRAILTLTTTRCGDFLQPKQAGDSRSRPLPKTARTIFPGRALRGWQPTPLPCSLLPTLLCAWCRSTWPICAVGRSSEARRCWFSEAKSLWKLDRVCGKLCLQKSSFVVQDGRKGCLFKSVEIYMTNGKIRLILKLLSLCSYTSTPAVHSTSTRRRNKPGMK